MEIKFIGQGLDPQQEGTAGNQILNSLSSNRYSTFNAFVAFVSTGGLKNIMDEMAAFTQNGGTIKFFLGVNLNATSKEALEELLEKEIETYVVYSPNNIIYHPKIYAFEGDEVTRTIIGSSNLTESGLFQNIEASVCVDFTNEDESGSELLADIYDHFNSIINANHPSCQLLTQEILDILVESKVVLPEGISRKKTNKVKKEFGQKDTKAHARLLELFGKVPVKKPPKGFRRKSVKSTFDIEDNNEVSISEEIIELAEGSMWIETGAMTGGSRNILDLSKSGKLEGEEKFGSVSYFGIDPENMTQTKDVDIEFEGKTYKNNHVFYAPGNSNWRIRINGVTDDKEKITAFSKPTLGNNGGFQHKLLLFTKLDDTNFRLEVLDVNEKEKLIDNSADWARGGGGSGRAYGII